MASYSPNDVILVTGASSGIGRATCVSLNSQGASVIAVGRNADELAITKSTAPNPDLVTTVTRDLSEDLEEIPAWLKEWAGTHGKLRGLVHCAGILNITAMRRQGDEDMAIIGVGLPHLRRKIFLRLKERGVRFFNLIHPTAIIGAWCQIGEGNVFCPNTVLTTHVQLGNGNMLNLGATVGHDVVIGDFNVISSHCDITGYASMGNENFLGSHSSVLPRAKIGSVCKVSAGSVVYKGLSDRTIAMGNPARKVGSTPGSI